MIAPRSPWPCRLLLFDLDGTLIDSKDDITSSVNRTLRRMSFRAIPPERIASFVGNGVQNLIECSLREALGCEPEAEQVRSAMDRYQREYGEHLLDSTRLYAGVPEAIERLSWARLGVVTNKPEVFSRRILDGLGLRGRFCAILGGDSVPARKPDPAPLREAMVRCGAVASETVMIGDSAVDILAGRAAGVVTCGIAGGFRGRRELEEAGSDFIVERFTELPDLFTIDN